MIENTKENEPRFDKTGPVNENSTLLSENMPQDNTQKNHLVTDDGAFAPEWYNHFDELKPCSRTLAKFKRPEALAKSYAALESLRGYPDPSDSEKMRAFRRMMGLPENAEDFILERPQEATDELWDDALARKISTVAYEYGIPRPALQALVDSYTTECRNHLNACRDEQQEAVEQAEYELQREWGTHYEKNLQAVSNTLRLLGERSGVDVDALMSNPSLMANADFIRILNEASKLTEEAPMRGGQAPTDGKEEARRMLHDPSHPLHEAFMKSNHPKHKYANELYDKLAFGR